MAVATIHPLPPSFQPRLLPPSAHPHLLPPSPLTPPAVVSPIAVGAVHGVVPVPPGPDEQQCPVHGRL